MKFPKIIVALLGQAPSKDQLLRTGSRIAGVGLWQAMERHAGIHSVVGADLPAPARLYLRVHGRLFYPKHVRFVKCHFNVRVFKWRSRNVTRKLQRIRAEECSVVLQEGFFFSPSMARMPYYIYTDANIGMLLRGYPQARPWPTGSAAERDGWDLQRQLFRSAAGCFTFSDCCRNAVLADHGSNPDNVLTVYAGKNFSALTTADLSPKRVLFVGTHFERKGGVQLLAAWKQIHARHPDAKLVIVGPEALPEQVPGVEFHGMVSDRDRLRAIFLSSSVFVMPSEWEAYGHVFLEAMACGLPCVGVDAFAMPEMIRHEVNGLLAVPKDVNSLAKCLDRLLSDPALRERLSAGALQTAKEWPDWETVAGRMLRFMEEQLPRTSATGSST